MIRTGTLAYWTHERRNGDALTVVVSVVDHREIFGRSEFLITPYNGRGTTWVTEDTLAEKAR